MLLDYLSCFGVVFIRDTGEHVIYAKLIMVFILNLAFSSYSDSYRNYNIQANGSSTKIKEKWSTWCFWSFYHFFCSNVPANKCHKQKWCMLFFTCIKLVVSVLVCVHAITCIKWRILMTTSILSWIKFYKISIKIRIFFRLLPFRALLLMTHQGGNQTSKVSCYKKLLMLHIYGTKTRQNQNHGYFTQ